MSRLRAVQVAAIFVLLGPTRVCVYAQEPDSASVSQRAALYSPKSPVAAGLLEYMMPIAGYAYAGNWTKGLPPAALRIGGVILAAPCLIAFITWEDPPSDNHCSTGFAIGLVGTVWGVAGAVRTAQRHNRTQRDNRVSVLPILHRRSLGISVTY